MAENHKLSYETVKEFCIVVQDTGFCGSAEEYVKKYYDKPFSELTETEALFAIQYLKDKKGCLAEVAVEAVGFKQGTFEESLEEKDEQEQSGSADNPPHWQEEVEGRE